MTNDAHVFELLSDGGYEQVVFCHDPASGLRAIVAIHSTVLGPALGGTRFWPFASEHEALVDVLRLAKGMTYKAAVSGLDLGGGKAVIIGDPRRLRSEALLRAYGRFVDGLSGRYITAEDVGTTKDDMDLVSLETRHVTGVSVSLGGSGDPSPATAWGVLWAMRAVAEHRWGTTALDGLRVAVSGVGKVGLDLVHHLVDEGAKVTVADVNPDAVENAVGRYGATAVDPDQLHTTECDIYAPCALGAVLNERTIPELRCGAVCGSANNQLATPEDGERLAEAGILYAPDYVVNAGGLMNVAEELRGYDQQRAYERIRGIEGNIRRVLATAEAEGITPADAADRVAEARIEAIAALHRIRPGRGSAQ
ncbi:MAG TPA: Glu/Leu/Phe/Val dehydrogenase [Acidimicrobiales bacterium]